jgi:ribosome biogenesis GTPase / thiamine phosphate phosphatase
MVLDIWNYFLHLFSEANYVKGLLMAASMIMIWWILEIVTMLFNSYNRNLHDFIADTVVIKTKYEVPSQRTGILNLIINYNPQHGPVKKTSLSYHTEMKLEDLGYNDRIEKLRIGNNLKDFEIGRVVSEHKERYVVKNEAGEYESEITGNMRFSANGREDFPAVGDWVALTTYDSGFSIIHKIIPRLSIISRQAVGHFGEIQIIATNIDFAIILQAADRDFNVNRLERYLTICYSSKVSPVIVLTKIDLIPELSKTEIIEHISQRIKNVPVFAISNETQDGYEALKTIIQKGRTYCMLGSSGVGKSTLLNNLSGRKIMKTGSISESTSKGRHVTSHRELIILENGGILIDNPGMREVGIVDTASGLETTFDTIFNFSQNCKFKDCTHTNETGCSVIKAVEDGELDKSFLENYHKMERERSYFEESQVERRRKEKIFGKIIKDYNKKDVKRRRN